ncbi:calnexin isoform X1 [Coregonus clupeaformis]|uniref:calnexin isoform X1 n=1 Tax=Coregonus clupeaformis TaxID=59861 RepID=UPI001E1C3263|nr:calnexin isoform X1 [Coregonus clupeaformis]XP_041706763.2 calnexin isoform X1 [Coregonus clupeaformis]
MELNVRCVLLLALGLCSTLLMTTVAAHQEEEEPIMEMAGDVEDELEDLGLGEELLDGEVEPEEADTPTGPPPAPKVIYKAPEPMGEHFFAESFDRGTLDSWVLSKAKKEDIDEDIAKYDGKWEVEDMKDSKLPGDKGLVLKSRAKHHAISAQLLRPFIFDTKPLIVQYEVNFQQGIDCGGAYVKLLSQTPHLNLDEFVDKTPYTIMFGPDKCGEDYKLHFIFRHRNPKTGEYEEKHAKKPDADLRTYYTDKKTHLYTLVLNPDNSFEVLVDQTVVNSGNLLTDVTPPINPAAEIEDPDDHKPEDWDERPKIQDPDAVKPEDWDEDAPKQIPDEDAVKPDGWLDDQPEYTSDPDAVKPEDWDEDMDGEWEAPQVPNALCETAPGCGAWQRPMIDNPNYKGKWKAPMIDNPNYQGVWKPRKIANPDFFEDLHPFRMTPFIAVGLELWSMSSDIFFDNFFISNERHTAERWANDGWGMKKAAEGAAEPGLVNQMMTAADERPWLWVVYVLTVAVPFVLLIVFFCTGKKAAAPAAADYKKTDEPQPDVKEEEEEKAEEDQVKEEKSQPAAAAEKKSDAEDSPAEKEDEEEEEEEEEAAVNEEGEEEDDEAADQKQEDDVLRRSPRNTKGRKD